VDTKVALFSRATQRYWNQVIFLYPISIPHWFSGLCKKVWEPMQFLCPHFFKAALIHRSMWKHLRSFVSILVQIISSCILTLLTTVVHTKHRDTYKSALPVPEDTCWCRLIQKIILLGFQHIKVSYRNSSLY